MPLITFKEIIYLLITTVVIGYIFSGFTTKFKGVDYFKRFDLQDFKLAILVAAPGIILHELSHKFVAMFYGLTAQFQIFTFGLILGALLKFFGSPFILLAPGYVGISSGASEISMVLIAFAGPFINLVLWISSSFLLKSNIKLARKQAILILLTREINKWLFIFNMLPIPPLDGSKVWFGLFKLIF